jgi:hypothetical protein
MPFGLYVLFAARMAVCLPGGMINVKQDRFLVAILAGIGLLIVVAVVVVMSQSSGGEQYLSDNTPRGVVHNYFLALQRKDYEKAYGYLSDELKNKPDLDRFIIDISNAGIDREASLKIGDISQTDGYAEAELAITNYRTGDIFNSGRYTTDDSAVLRQDTSGEWRLIQFPYPYWVWQWNEEPRD